MKIIPRKISNIDLLRETSKKGVSRYGVYINSEDNNHNALLLGTPNSKFDFSVMSDLFRKNAYASGLLYFAENINIENANMKDLLEDINVMLHSRCKVINEKAPLLTKIGNYPIYEGANYILRGEGDNKIKECFDLKEDINIDDIDLDFIKTHTTDDIIKDFIKCPKCGNVYENDSLIPNYPDYPDDYSGDISDEPLTYSCPYCNFTTENEDTFSDAWIEDLENAPNADEFVPGLRKYIDTLRQEDIKEEAGTQASDIAAKVDYSFQSAPTPAKPCKKKRKYESVEIKELDESTYINLTGFIKDVDGFYKRGNYVLVKESANNALKVIHKNKLYEEVVDVQVDAGETISNYLKNKLDKRFPDRFDVRSGKIDDVFGIVIKDHSNHDTGDLIDVTDFINQIMSYLHFDKTDYEIDYKGNSLIMAIYNNKKLSSNEFAS